MENPTASADARQRQSATSHGRIITRFIRADARAGLRRLRPGSVHCIVTSPPYFGLRSYLPPGHADAALEIGREVRPAEFVASLVDVFAEAWLVLRPDGLLFVNIGDSFANDSKWGGSSGGKATKALHGETGIGRGKRDTNLPPKCRIGIPWRFALAMIDAGWILRQEVIWHKSNPLPESMDDRPTTAHEQVFIFAKQSDHFADMWAVREAGSGRVTRAGQNAGGRGHDRHSGNAAGYEDDGLERNCRSVWTGPVANFKASRIGVLDCDHFATMPLWLAERCIRIGTSERGACGTCGAALEREVTREHPPRAAEVARNHRDGGLTVQQGMDRTGLSHFKLDEWQKAHPPVTSGWVATCDCKGPIVPCIVLDPFGGAGTTALAASRLKRDSILIDLDERSERLIRARLEQDAPMFNRVEVVE